MSTKRGYLMRKSADGFQQHKKQSADEIKPEEEQSHHKKKQKLQARLKREYEKMVINGIVIFSPFGLSLYPTQKLMMVKMLQSLKNGWNAMIESPTGSGKTLALLSSSCAWLANYKLEKEESKKRCQVHGFCIDQTVATAASASFCEAKSCLNADNNTPTTTNDEFNVIKVEDKEHEAENTSISSAKQERKPLVDSSHDISVFEPTKCTCLPTIRIYYGTRTHRQISQVVKEFGRLPFGANSILKHTILASREQSCVNKTVKGKSDVTSHCKELISGEGLGCRFRNELRKFDTGPPQRLRTYIEENNGCKVWDMEDLVKSLGKTCCPYFASTRIMAADADIIFCPFNYLLDPIIRSSSEVHLENSIAILDEAHNVEDTCRDAASFQLQETELMWLLENVEEKLRELVQMLQNNDVESYEDAYPLDNDSDMSPADKKICLQKFAEALKTLLSFGKDLHCWFAMLAKEGIRLGKKKMCGSSSHTFDSNKLQHSLLSTQLLPKGSQKEVHLRAAFNILTGSKSGGDYSAAHDKLVTRFRPSASAIFCVEKFLYFSYFFNSIFVCSSTFAFASSKVEGEKSFVSNQQFYRCNISMAPSEEAGNNINRRSSNHFRGLRKSDHQKGGSPWLNVKGKPMVRQPIEEITKVESIRPGHDISINLWCMVPSVAFMDAFNQSRSVVLASGTLCPTESLRSELGLDFKSQMEGEQVISKDRIFASVLSVGPTGKSLNATFKNIAGGSEFITELARVVVSTCFTVPKGILCFVSSYKVMDLLVECLKTHPRLQEKKKLLEEPRRSNELQTVLEEYNEAIEEPELVGPRCDGALMVAVFRGKVSEGIDFADDRARCVICVGIPFPNAYDDLVLQKKLFNNENCRSTTLLNGDEWYTTQAYRALNQALGRCLRHKDDWGALLLVDERFLNKADAKSSDANKISKWVRERLFVYNDYKNFQSALKKFVQLHAVEKKNEEPRKLKKEETLMSEEDKEESVEVVKLVPKTSNLFK